MFTEQQVGSCVIINERLPFRNKFGLTIAFAACTAISRQSRRVAVSVAWCLCRVTNRLQRTRVGFFSYLNTSSNFPFIVRWLFSSSGSRRHGASQHDGRIGGVKAGWSRAAAAKGDGRRLAGRTETVGTRSGCSWEVCPISSCDSRCSALSHLFYNASVIYASNCAVVVNVFLRVNVCRTPNSIYQQ